MMEATPKCPMCILLAKVLTDLTESAVYANRNNARWGHGTDIGEDDIYYAQKALAAFAGAMQQVDQQTDKVYWKDMAALHQADLLRCTAIKYGFSSDKYGGFLPTAFEAWLREISGSPRATGEEML